jgi:hypothetical protein
LRSLQSAAFRRIACARGRTIRAMESILLEAFVYLGSFWVERSVPVRIQVKLLAGFYVLLIALAIWALAS